MKLKYLAMSTILAMGLFACNNTASTDETSKVDQEEVDQSAESAEEKSYSIDTESSTINWFGEVPNIKSHSGTIDIQEGSVTAQGQKIIGGNFVVDMTTITPTDENYDESGTKEKLVGHLSAGDFFLVEEYPTASFKITGMEEGNVIGDLTIRDKTNSETVVIESIETTENGLTASGKLTFDRQKYDVAWAGMKDYVLADEIALDIMITASAAE